MQSYSLEIGGVKVNLRKMPHEPIVLAKIGVNAVEISIAEKKIEVISGEVPAEIWEVFKKVVIQYFL